MNPSRHPADMTDAWVEESHRPGCPCIACALVILHGQVEELTSERDRAMSDHLGRRSDRLDAIAAIAKAHRSEANHRAANDDWIVLERMAIVVEANRWAGWCDWRSITVDDVESIEHNAMGHSDYVDKLALYVVEWMCGHA